MNEEKQSLKQMFKAKSQSWANNFEGRTSKEKLIKKFSQLREKNQYFDVESKDEFLNLKLSHSVEKRREFAYFEDTLYCLNRINGKLESYEFLKKLKDGTFDYMQCKEFVIGTEDSSITQNYRTYCMEVLSERNGEFVRKTLQIYGSGVWDMDRYETASERTEKVARYAQSQMKKSQEIFTAIKNTFDFYEILVDGIADGTTKFGIQVKQPSEEDLPQPALFFSFNKNVFSKPLTIFTPHAENPFPTVTNDSTLYLPFDFFTTNGISTTLEKISATDMIEMPWLVDNSPQSTKTSAEKELK